MIGIMKCSKKRDVSLVVKILQQGRVPNCKKGEKKK